jgi:hypothetical protein
MVPAIGTNPVSQQPYNNGVTTIPVNLNANGNTDDAVRNAVVNRLGGKPADVDLVMLCIPPGTVGDWYVHDIYEYSCELVGHGLDSPSLHAYSSL